MFLYRSLLVFTRADFTFRHFCSAGGMNNAAAQQLMKAVAPALRHEHGCGCGCGTLQLNPLQMGSRERESTFLYCTQLDGVVD